jgi:hypothetical protein
LVAKTLPWLGGTFRATCAGVPPNTSGLVLGVLSFTPLAPALPLNAWFPQAGAGCNLLIAADNMSIVPVTTVLVPPFTLFSTAESSLALPTSSSLAGLTFYHQMIAINYVFGVPVEMTATNALKLRIGVF